MRVHNACTHVRTHRAAPPQPVLGASSPRLSERTAERRLGSAALRSLGSQTLTQGERVWLARLQNVRLARLQNVRLARLRTLYIHSWRRSSKALQGGIARSCAHAFGRSQIFAMRFKCVFVLSYIAIFKYSLASNDHGQGQMISSSLAGRAACAGEDVTLTCAVLGAGRLTWVISSSAKNILFNLADDASLTTQTDSTGQFTASLIHYSRHQQYYFLGNLTSTLHTIVNPSLMEYPIKILCYNGISNNISVPSYINIAGKKTVKDRLQSPQTARNYI